MSDAASKLAEAYWEAFRQGVIGVSGQADAYPSWKASRDPVKNETVRCLRHAMEKIRHPTAAMLEGQPNKALAKEVWESMFEVLFPGKPEVRRQIPLTESDRKLRAQSHMQRRRQ